MKISLIGFGKIGKKRYEYLLKQKDIEVCKIYDPENIDKIPGGNKVKNVQEIFESDCDAIFISTPNYFNAEYTLLGIKNNKHVFCEKPPAINLNQLGPIEDELKKNKVKLMYGFNHRFHPSIQALKSLIDSKKYGNILWMRGRYGKSVDSNFFVNWRSKKDLAGGGILIDQGIHMLDIFLHLAGSFDQSKAMLSNLYWKLEGIEDNAFVLLKDSSTGIVASLHSTMTQWRHLFSLEVFLEKGYCVINGLKTNSNTYGKEILTIATNRSSAPAATWENEEKIEFKVDNSFEEEINYFLNAIKENLPIKTGNIEDAKNIMKLIDQIYEENIDVRNNININPKTQ